MVYLKNVHIPQTKVVECIHCIYHLSIEGGHSMVWAEECTHSMIIHTLCNIYQSNHEIETMCILALKYSTPVFAFRSCMLTGLLGSRICGDLWSPSMSSIYQARTILECLLDIKQQQPSIGTVLCRNTGKMANNLCGLFCWNADPNMNHFGLIWNEDIIFWFVW